MLDNTYDDFLGKGLKLGKSKEGELCPPATSKTYSIGDVVNGGVVFWLDSTGQHGEDLDTNTTRIAFLCVK